MTLFKRGAIWWSFFSVDGIRYQKSTGTSNKRNAQRIADKLKEEANLRRFQIVDLDPHLTFNALADQFEKTKPTAHNLDRLKHLRPFFGPLTIREITKATVQDYRTARKVEKPKLTDSTLNKDVGVIRHIFFWAVDAQIIPTNPLTRVPMARVRRVKRPVLTVADEEKILAVAPKHLQRIVIAALDTGMRRGELLQQRWEDVDLPRKLLYVTRSKTPEGEAREIPLTTRLHALLEEKKQLSGFVFTYGGHDILDPKTAWFRAQKTALDRHFRFHDLRHTFNTRLLEAGVISDVRKAIMGHEDRSVHEAYSHVELPAKREAILKLEKWIKLQKKKRA